MHVVCKTWTSWVVMSCVGCKGWLEKRWQFSLHRQGHVNRIGSQLDVCGMHEETRHSGPLGVLIVYEDMF